MYQRLIRAALAVGAVTLLLGLAACGGATSATSTTSTTMLTDATGSEFAFGGPADPADADRTVEIVASDDFRFDPDELTVTAGEVITFHIVNDGQLTHDFTLGGEATQDEHEEEMAEMGGMTMPDAPNAVSVPAGESKDLTWRFGEAGAVLMGCHQTGHYAGGMKGQITVES